MPCSSSRSTYKSRSGKSAPKRGRRGRSRGRRRTSRRQSEYVPRSRIPWRIKNAAKRFSREQILAIMYKMDRENEPKSYSSKSTSRSSFRTVKRGSSGSRSKRRRTKYIPRSKIPARIKKASRRFTRSHILAMLYDMDRENESNRSSSASKSGSRNKRSKSRKTSLSRRKKPRLGLKIRRKKSTSKRSKRSKRVKRSSRNKRFIKKFVRKKSKKRSKRSFRSTKSY